MKKILYYGWMGHSNVGDEMYKVAFPTLFPGTESRFVSGLTKKDLAWCDEVIVGGGNIVDPHFVGTANRLVKGVRPCSLYSVGFTSDQVKAEELTMFDRIWVRDHHSLRRIESLGLSADLCPDASWVLEPDRDHGRGMWESLYRRQGGDLYERRIVVVLNAHLTSAQPDLLAREEARFMSFVHDMVSIVDGMSASFAFVPFGREMRWDDRVPNSWVAHKCKWFRKNAVVWDGDWGVGDTLDFLSAADAVVSMRLHSTIFAAIGNTPFLDITHHDKNRGFLESSGLSSWGVDYWDFSRERARRLLEDLMSRGDEHRETLCRLSGEHRNRLLGYVETLKNSKVGK